MKKIEAIIRLTKFEDIRQALADIDVPFFTLKEVKGFGLQKSKAIVYRGSSYDADYIPRLQLEIFCTSEKAHEIVNVILEAGRTGAVGDGKIAVIELEAVYRIRNGAAASEAIY